MKKTVLAVFLLAPLFNFLHGQTNTFPSSGSVGIGTTSPTYKLDVVAPENTWKARFQGPDGYITIGPANSSWAHIYTDRPNFIFNAGVWSTGPFSSYSTGDMILQTHGTTRMTISNTSGNVGIGTTNPQYYRLELVDPNINESGIRSATTYGGNSSYSLVAYSPSYSNVPAYANKAVLQTYDNPIAFSAYGTTSNNQIQFYTGGRTDLYKRMVLDQNGNIGMGVSAPYSASRLHIKSPGATPWGFIVEASSNDKIVGVSHDGTNGIISTSYLASGGYSGLELRTQNITRVNIGVDGNVGIGASAPSYKFQVSGGAIALDEDQPLRGGGRWLISGNSTQVTVGTANPGIALRFDAGAVNRMFINGTTGNIGIGTASPSEKLTVNGTIYGTRVKVDLTVPGPDYVFEKDYNLPSLEEIAKYVEEHKHLEGAPSAKEMEKNGIDVGEMNMLLLKKVEELMLYAIEANKNITEANRKIESQQKQIEELIETVNKKK